MEYSEGYVAFIDILGFSNYVAEKQNAEKVAKLFSFVDKFCHLFNTSEYLGIHVSFFSDSIVLSTDEFVNLIVPIYIAEEYLKKELKLLFRGGITKGQYFFSEGVTFGPAVVSAYRLEKEAYYSRILIDKKIIDENTNSGLEIYCDIDGKWCLNLSSLIVFEETSFGIEGEGYPDGDPGDIIRGIFKRNRDSILESIAVHIGTPVVEKYIWRVRQFNYTCKQYAENPAVIPMFKSLNYEPPEDFCKALLDLRINNVDYESEF